MAKCRIDSFRLRGTGSRKRGTGNVGIKNFGNRWTAKLTNPKKQSRCHMFSFNVEFSDACRFRVFQCHFAISNPSFSVIPVLTRTNRVLEVAAFLPNIQNVVTNFSCWQCFCTLLGPISLLYKQFTVHAVEIFHCTIHFINLISKEVSSCETFSIRYHFHKIVHENTLKVFWWTAVRTMRACFAIALDSQMKHGSVKAKFALTLPCFIWLSRAIAKHARIVLTAFCQCSSFTVNGVTKI